MKRVILFLISVFLLGCPPTPEAGELSLGEVSVSPATGFNTTENFKFTAAVSVPAEASLSVEVRDAAGKTVKKLSDSVRAGEKSKTITSKIDAVGKMKAVFILAAEGAEPQTKTAEFEVKEGGIPSAAFEWPTTGVYQNATITVGMSAVCADVAGTGTDTYALKSAAFTAYKDNSGTWETFNGFTFPALTADNLNTGFNLTLSEIGKFRIVLEIENTAGKKDSRTVEFEITDYKGINIISATPNTFTGQILNDTVTVTLNFTGNGEEVPSDISVTWSQDDAKYTVVPVATASTATSTTWQITIKTTDAVTITATSTVQTDKSVGITFNDTKQYKVDTTKTVEGKALSLLWAENFNNKDEVLKNWRAAGYIDATNKVKRFYWRPEALEMTELDGKSVFTMFTREWGTRPGEDTTKTPYYPGQDQSNGNNTAGEKWISGGIHLQKNIVFGYIETRVRTDRKDKNHWDAFWSYDSDANSPLWYEFDVMEAITATDLDVTTHFWNRSSGRFWDQPTKKHGSVDLNSDWYTLGIYWSPEEVVYYGYHGTEPRRIASFKKDFTFADGYSKGTRAPKNNVPLITRWKQGFKFTTELGYSYGSGRPATGTEDKYYIDYFAVYQIPVSQAVLAENVENGTISFDREVKGNDLAAWADIASAGNKIYVNVTPVSGYLIDSVTATWNGGSVALTEESERRYYLEVTDQMPQYFDFETQQYGEKVAITPVFTQNAAAPELTEVTLSADPASGFSGETITVTETLNPSDAVVSAVAVDKGIYERTTKTLTLPENTGDEAITETVTFTYTTKGNKTVTATLNVTVYPDTYVRRNGVVYQPMKTVEDFSGQDITITQPENGNALNVANQNLIITVNALETAETNTITVNNIPDNTGLNALMELTVNYATSDNVSKFRAVASFSQGASHSFWIIRNAYNGTPGNGFAFRAGPNANDANATYTMLANQDVTYGYLFDGSTCQTTDNKAKFFFNGNLKTITLKANTVTKAPVLGTSFTLKFSKEASGVDPGTITLKKIVFYKPVTE